PERVFFGKCASVTGSLAGERACPVRPLPLGLLSCPPIRVWPPGTGCLADQLVETRSHLAFCPRRGHTGPRQVGAPRPATAVPWGREEAAGGHQGPERSAGFNLDAVDQAAASQSGPRGYGHGGLAGTAAPLLRSGLPLPPGHAPRRGGRGGPHPGVRRPF